MTAAGKKVAEFISRRRATNEDFAASEPDLVYDLDVGRGVKLNLKRSSSDGSLPTLPQRATPADKRSASAEKPRTFLVPTKSGSHSSASRRTGPARAESVSRRDSCNDARAREIADGIIRLVQDHFAKAKKKNDKATDDAFLQEEVASVVEEHYPLPASYGPESPTSPRGLWEGTTLAFERASVSSTDALRRSLESISSTDALRQSLESIRDDISDITSYTLLHQAQPTMPPPPLTSKKRNRRRVTPTLDSAKIPPPPPRCGRSSSHGKGGASPALPARQDATTRSSSSSGSSKSPPLASPRKKGRGSKPAKGTRRRTHPRPRHPSAPPRSSDREEEQSGKTSRSSSTKRSSAKSSSRRSSREDAEDKTVKANSGHRSRAASKNHPRRPSDAQDRRHRRNEGAIEEASRHHSRVSDMPFTTPWGTSGLYSGDTIEGIPNGTGLFTAENGEEYYGLWIQGFAEQYLEQNRRWQEEWMEAYELSPAQHGPMVQGYCNEIDYWSYYQLQPLYDSE